MKDYRGEVTVHGEITPTEYPVTGDDDAGPGQWVLRIRTEDRPVVKSASETGGWISEPTAHLLAPFTPTYG